MFASVQGVLDILQAATAEVFQPEVLLVIVIAAIYGIFVGSIPGLTATMAVALMVPLTFFLDSVEAVAAIVTTVTCSIFAGDLPATLVRIPGTPASAAYAEDAYRLTCLGRHREALGVSLMFSVIGGLFGTLVLVAAAPQLARFATQFTSYEYFWLYVLGLTCAAIVSDDSRWKASLSLGIGLLLSTIGLGTDYSQPRLTGGLNELVMGINFIPAMIGLFGLSEVFRNVLGRLEEPRPPTTSAADDASSENAASEKASVDKTTSAEPGQIESAPLHLAGILKLAWRRKLSLIRSSSIGALVGMLPGAGADIAAWISYAVSKRFSRHPEQYGKGSIEGLGDATGANNAALGGAWIPALVFGIPGDSVTAIAIGVLLMKNITPGPDIFDVREHPDQAVLVYSIYVTFFLANLLLIPFGLLAIKLSSLLIAMPRRILLPLVLVFCMVGSFAMNGSYFDVLVMLVMGLLGFFIETAKVPLGPVVLGIILGGPLEHKFVQSVTKSDSWLAFLQSPISCGIALIAIGLWIAPLLMRLLGRPSSNASAT